MNKKSLKKKEINRTKSDIAKNYESFLSKIQLNKKQKDRIEEARTEYKNSQTLTEEQTNNEIDEWLKEK